MADHHPPSLFGRRPQIAAGGEFRGSFDFASLWDAPLRMTARRGTSLRMTD
jgi:hypothetical protein